MSDLLDILNPEELLSEETENITLDELETFLKSPIFTWIVGMIDRDIQEIHINLEDPDGPLEDFQFQRGRVREARLIKNQFITLYAEVKQRHQQTLEEQDDADAADE